MGLFKRSNKDETNLDFEAFKADISWFIKPNLKIEFPDFDGVRLSEEFRAAFPKLSELIDNSRQTHVIIDSVNYLLFAWDSKEGQICGWLNQLESTEAIGCELIEEHELLLRNIGGIKESFNEPDDAFSNNQNFLFLGSECTRGIGDWEDYYTMACEDHQKEEIDHSNLLAFVQEANGALTLYEPETKKVLLFSHDHYFDHVEVMEHQPEYTFHTIKNVDTFEDYVEELARQWGEIIK